MPAAMTYERDVALMNAVYPNCATTGGSVEAPRETVEQELTARRISQRAAGERVNGNRQGEYWADFRPLRTMPIEELLAAVRAAFGSAGDAAGILTASILAAGILTTPFAAC
jgi:hypothetical protein